MVMKNVNLLAGVFFSEAISEAGVTVASICKEIGVAQPTMSRVLKGESDMTLERMYGLCGALDLEPDAVLEYIAENQKSAGRKANSEKASKTVAKVNKRAAKEEEAPRRRGRPAAVKTVAKASKVEKAAPAKRGRPAKVEKVEAKPVKKTGGKISLAMLANRGKSKPAKVVGRRKPM